MKWRKKETDPHIYRMIIINNNNFLIRIVCHVNLRRVQTFILVGCMYLGATPLPGKILKLWASKVVFRGVFSDPQKN